MKCNDLRAIYYVRDLKSIRDFYENALNFAVTNSWDEPSDKGVLYDTGCGILEFMFKEDAPPRNNDVRVAFGIDNVWSLYDSLQNKVTFTHYLKDNWWGETSFGIKDPAGLELVFLTETAKKNSFMAATG